MREITDELMKWSHDNKMLINCNKTKEMTIGKAKLESIPHLETDGKQIECACEFKILGLQLSNNLKWDRDIDLICKKMLSKLYFLKLLKRSGLSVEDIHCFYITVSNKANHRVCMHCLESQPNCYIK